MWIRLIGVATLLASAVIHLRLWFNGVRDQGTVGQLFVLNVVAGVVIAVMLLVWRHWIPAFLTAGFGAMTLGAFTIATTVGLFGIHDKWHGGYVWSAAFTDVVAILVGLALLARARSAGQLQQR